MALLRAAKDTGATNHIKDEEADEKYQDAPPRHRSVVFADVAVDEVENNLPIYVPQGFSSFTKRVFGSGTSQVLTGNQVSRRSVICSETPAPGALSDAKERHSRRSSLSSYFRKSSSRWYRFRKRVKYTCHSILDNKLTSVFMSLATLWALSGDDA